MVVRLGLPYSHPYQVPARVHHEMCGGQSGVTKWDNKRNTELRVMAGLERVEVMLMRRRLRWLGHVARME